MTEATYIHTRRPFVKHVIDQSLTAMFALLRRNRLLDLHINLQLELFYSLIRPTLLYGSDIWGFENIRMIEKIHLKYLKYIIGCKAINTDVHGIGGKRQIPLVISIKCRMISYWSKLLCHVCTLP